MGSTNKGSKGSHGQLEAKESLAMKTEKKPRGKIGCGKGVRGSALQTPPASLHGGQLVLCDS